MTPPRFPGIGLALAALLLAGASPRPDPDALLREGDGAFAQGDYATAIARYERAEVFSTDPRAVAFRLATAKYRLATADDPPLLGPLAEAEQLYRCCVEPGDPRRAPALLALGNCLMLRSGDRDEAGLRASARCYEQCLAAAGGDARLAADARYNRERVRLLLLQFQAPPGSQDKQGGEDSDTNPRPPDRQQAAVPNPGGDPGFEGKPDPRSGAVPVPQDQGPAPAKGNEQPPGEGNLPPIPDEAELSPLSARDATAHLDQATKRIVEERQAHRRAGARPPAPGVRDW